ncbi:hypothetical protein D187_006458 [Cystobacter fuscus DSM 2262]|uniref:Uncharacterized protein n=1 Tax=Cystobacter fuscus (strain ATCC 25194 / DSM 2262 / NBRC 100088 / M29) TaxID=1242864 RepID=S9R2B4_CYSF2|nr:tetratricopeptide repeat protein [Cystobacter fuscus]EPX63048.1 hypothetical protein D187_006458 [Cystobacter fuscus DSM 2262]
MSRDFARARARVWLCLGLLLCSLPFTAGAAGLLEKEHPLIQQGRRAYDAGRYEDALSSFEQAKKERPNDPAVDFNRGDALTKLGRYDEAKQAFQGVAEANSRPDLRQKATYNLGNVHAALGDTREAMKAYRRALTMDPTDAQARHNYEVLLRNLPPPQKGGGDGGTDGGQDGGQDAGQDGGRPDAGQPDGGQDGGQDGGSDGGSDAGQDGGSDGGEDGGAGDSGTPDAGPGDAGPGDGGPQDGGGDGGEPADGGEGGDGGQQGDGGQSEDAEASDAGSPGEIDELDGGVSAEEIDRQEAERLLDAMKQNEKNLQLWRFQQKKRPRNPNEKDW